MIIGNPNIHSTATTLYDKLANEFNKNYNSITLCSAFLSESASKSLIQLIDSIDNHSLKLTIMIGIKNNFTSPSAIQILIDYIKTCNKPNIEFNLMLPMDNDFHLKAYIFMNDTTSKAIIGSANLTDTGLKSKGELMVEIDNINNHNTIEDIIDHIDQYLNDSEKWINCIDKYRQVYDKNKPTINQTDTASLKPKRLKLKRPSRLNTKKPNRLTIRATAPSMGTLVKVSKEKQDIMDNAYNLAKFDYPNINKGNSIIFSDLSTDDIQSIYDDYPIGSSFDRPRYINQNWNIGDNRSICVVGAIIKTQEDELVMFMKKGCIHYKVTEDILKLAEEIGIKSDGDFDPIPSKANMDYYRDFIKNYKKSNN